MKTKSKKNTHKSKRGQPGGIARAKKMTAGQRSKSARNAALARWKKHKESK